jgi:hypothetical protein
MRRRHRITRDTLIKSDYFSLDKTACIFPEVRYNRATIPLIILTAYILESRAFLGAQHRSGMVKIAGKNIATITSYWFAWYAFHPQTKVYRYR